MVHSPRAVVSNDVSLRTRCSSWPMDSRTDLSTIGLISLETLRRNPAIGKLTSLITTLPVRLGAIRHAGRIVGRAVTATLPRTSAFWSNALPARPCSCLPTSPPSWPMTLPSAPPSWPPTLPTAPRTPLARSVPLSALDTVRPSLRPAPARGPRLMTHPILRSIGSSRVAPLRSPLRLRGAADSIAF